MIDPHCKIGKVKMKSNLRFLPNVEAHPVAVLQSAMNEAWDNVVVCGINTEGETCVYGSSSDKKTILYSLEKAKQFILKDG